MEELEAKGKVEPNHPSQCIGSLGTPPSKCLHSKDLMWVTHTMKAIVSEERYSKLHKFKHCFVVSGKAYEGFLTDVLVDCIHLNLTASGLDKQWHDGSIWTIKVQQHLDYPGVTSRFFICEGHWINNPCCLSFYSPTLWKITDYLQLLQQAESLLTLIDTEWLARLEYHLIV